MNDPLVLESARSVVLRVDQEEVKDDRARIERIYRLVLSRPPRPAELQPIQRYLAGQDPANWQRFVHALMQTNEFVWVD